MLPRSEVGVVALLEGIALPRLEWTNRLRLDPEDFAQLVAGKILRLEEAGHYRLAFVGIVVFAHSVLFAQPKFGDVAPVELPRLLRVLRTYFGRGALRRPVVDRSRDPEYGNAEVLREFDAMLALQAWFFAHGVYRREQTQASAHGRPHWVKTIAKCNPVLIQDSAVYPTIVAERREGVFNDISGLQVGVLRCLLERYGSEVPSALVHAQMATGGPALQWPIPDPQRSYFLRRLSIEQRGVFRTDTLHLFRLLKEALDSRLAGPMPRVQIYGTTAFYAVWEDACRVAMRASSIPEPARLLGQPIWWAYGPGGSTVRRSTVQIPDMVVQRDGWQLIIDAKYYYRFPDAFPGAPDIIKQLYYAESLRVAPEQLISLFLLPEPGALEPRFLGYAMIDEAHRSFGNVEAWGLDPMHLLSWYVAPSAGSQRDLIEAILANRQGVAELAGEIPANVGG